MRYEKYISMIDEYLQEPNNINLEWVECLTVCRIGLERMRPKKPSVEKDKVMFEIICGNCPVCGSAVYNTSNLFCHHCGQALNWRDE